MSIDFTDQERQLLLQTVMTSTYAGQLAELVLSVLNKLKGPSDPDED